MSRVRSIALGFVVSLSAGYSVADTCWIETASIFNTLPGYPTPIVFLEPMGIEAAVEESGQRYLKHDEGVRIQRLITAFVNPRMNEVWDRFPDFRGKPLKIPSSYFCVSDEADLLSRRARLTDTRRMTLMGDWAKALNAPAVASPSSSNRTAGDAAVSPGRFYLRLTKESLELDMKREALNKDAPGSPEARRVGAEYAAVQAAATARMHDYVLQLERANPNSNDARRAGAIYRGMLLDAAKIEWGTKPTVSKDVVAAAQKEWQTLVREKPGNPADPDTMAAERNYRALSKLADATKQDKGNKSTYANSGPVLTREDRAVPSADAGGPSKPAAQSHSSQPGSTSSSSSPSVPRTILCFEGTVPPPGYRCGTNKGSDAPGKGMSR